MGKHKYLEAVGLDMPAEKVSVLRGMGRDEEFEKMAEKYPEYPRRLLLKTDLLRRGVTLSKSFQEKLNNPYYEKSNSFFQWHSEDLVADIIPLAFKLSDGTIVGFCLSPPEFEPYTIDEIDGRMWVTSDGKKLEEIFLLPKPHWYGKKTSNGVLMEMVAPRGGDLLYLCPRHHCFYWNEGLQCRFCDLDYMSMFSLKMGRGYKTQVDPQDFYETLCEIVLAEGQYHNWFFTGGSDPRAGYSAEVNLAIDLLTMVKKAIKDTLGVEYDRLPICLIITPFEKDEVQKLYDAGASAIGGYLEVWDKEHFELVCPGKAKNIGRDTHIRRTVDEVEIFGKGNVNCGHTIGVEMAPPPYGFAEIDDAVNSTLEGYSFWIDHDIVPTGTNWRVEPGTVFYKLGAMPPPLEFYAKVDLGRHHLLQEYKRKNGYAISNDQLGIQNFQCFSCYPDFQKYL